MNSSELPVSLPVPSKGSEALLLSRLWAELLPSDEVVLATMVSASEAQMRVLPVDVLGPVPEAGSVVPESRTETNYAELPRPDRLGDSYSPYRRQVWLALFANNLKHSNSYF